MASLVKTLILGYNDLMDNRSDIRTKDWWLVTSPWPTLTACLSYVYFSKVLGPRIMENRKPLNMRSILVVYNAAQTIFSAWIFYEYLMSGWWGSYSFKCQPVDYSTSPQAMRMARTCWWYFFSKFTEFFDTLFFILRKKTEHVSTLHVVHHGIMPMSVWFGVRFAPGGHSTFFALLNTFVHIVMYFYYMIAAMGPKYQKYIWWKKYLTSFQMVQFVAIMSHQFQLLFRECNYPKGFMVWIGFHGVLFLLLFSDFYKSKYSSAKKKRNIAALKKDDNIKSSENGHYTNGSCHYENGSSLNGLTKRTTINGHTELNGKTVENGSLLNGHINENGSIKSKHFDNGSVQNGSLKNGHSITNDSLKNGSIQNSWNHIKEQ